MIKQTRTLRIQLTEEQAKFLTELLRNNPCEQGGRREREILSILGDAKREQWDGWF